MKRAVLAIACVACGSSAPPARMTGEEAAAAIAPAPAPVTPAARPWPATRRDAITDTVHGQQLADPYRWLEDEKSPEVQAWMNEQDAYARAELAKLPALAAYTDGFKKALYYDALGAPVHRKGRYFYTRKHADKEKTIVYWRQGDKGAEKVLLDPNAWSADGSAGLGGWVPSPDGKYVAYNGKRNNSDEAEAKIIEVATGKLLADTIPGTKYGGFSWTPDSKSFYYTWIPPVSAQVPIADRPGFAEIRFHKLATDPAADPIIHPATKNPATFLGGRISHDGKWLVAVIRHGWASTELFFKEARGGIAKPGAAWTPLVTGVNALFQIHVWRDKFYVHTNDGAPRYRVFKIDPKRPARASWQEIVPQSDATLDDVDIVGEHLTLTYMRNASSQLEIRDLAGKPVRKVELPGIGTSTGIHGDEAEDTGYFSFSSFTEPGMIFQTSIKNGTVKEWARVKVPIEMADMVSEQVFYPSKDGTKISMFIIRKKGAKQDGKNPTLLWGYGGFNANITPFYASPRAVPSVWVERGGIYAIPNLRGGGEYGEEWHRAGMLLNKQNVFDDYIAAAEYLIKEGWTSPAHLGIQGASNGGLLVGAVMTQRPELYKAVSCTVPLLDMLRYHLFGSGKTWMPEYGSAEDPAQWKALYAYSPYRRAVDAGPLRYPAVLFDSADHDDRVDPLHARKLTAVIQHAQTGTAPVLLRVERNAGHSGADLVKQQVERLAGQLAFFDSELR